jgi:uncharacterized protein (DUF1800 family)
MGPWAAYTPSKEAPWDRRRVVHLHRRAAFAATWEEVERDLKDGPGPSIDRLLKGKPRSHGVPEEFSAFADRLARSADLPRLKAWWIYRMAFGPDPLTERLTLLWHNHFATSAGKVGLAVRPQNALFRRLARAHFGRLLGAVVRDPALLVYLDAQANRRGHPNENLARELMELFTLGIGNYSERDVKEAARALTGWTVQGGAFREVEDLHDAGEKTVLGRKGHFKGGDLVKVLLDQPATARRLAWRLCEFFLGEGVATKEAVQALAAGLRRRDLDIGWAVETVLRSRLFFAAGTLGQRILSPLDFVVGAVRALELFDPPPSTLCLADWAARLGQDLFHPPNVGGWPGGREWISPRTMIGRANFAATLVVEGSLSAPARGADVLALARRHRRGGDLEALLRFATEWWQGTPPEKAWLRRLLAALGPRAAATPENARRAFALVLASPEAHLG